VAFVEVEAGTKIWQLNAALDELGYVLPTLGNVTGQSVGGVISTATHGKRMFGSDGSTIGTLSSLVERVRLVTADGTVEVVQVAGGGDRGRAVAVSVGMLGVLSTVTLRVERKHELEFSISTCGFEEGLRRLPGLLEQSEAVSLVYWPTLDSWRLEVATRPAPAAGEGPRPLPMPEQSRLKLFFCGALNVLLSYYYWVPGLLHLAHRIAIADGQSDRPYRGPSDRVVALNVEMDLEHHELEFAFDFERRAEVLHAYRDALRRLPPSIAAWCIIDVRVTGSDEAWLSPAHGRPTLWVDVVVPMRIKKHFNKLCKEVVPVAEAFGGRPHWGKINPCSAEYTRASFPCFAEFAATRREMDPQGVFGNVWLDKFFEDVTECSVVV